MEVVKEVEHCWSDLGITLQVLLSKMLEIQSLNLSDHRRMQAILDYYVRHCPLACWQHFAQKLQEMTLHKQAHKVTAKYIKGMDVKYVTCLILNQDYGS